MSKLLATVAVLATFCAAAPALAGGPGVPTGKWCEIDRPTEAEGWMFFRQPRIAETRTGDRAAAAD
jgi:hypothetical protein